MLHFALNPFKTLKNAFYLSVSIHWCHGCSGKWSSKAWKEFRLVSVREEGKRTVKKGQQGHLFIVLSRHAHEIILNSSKSMVCIIHLSTLNNVSFFELLSCWRNLHIFQPLLDFIWTQLYTSMTEESIYRRWNAAYLSSDETELLM